MANSFDDLLNDCADGLDLLDRQREMRKSMTAPAPLAADMQRTARHGHASAAAWKKLDAELRVLAPKVTATSAAIAARAVEVGRDRLRRGCGDVMAKADALFAAGAISGEELRRLESRVHHIGEAMRL